MKFQIAAVLAAVFTLTVSAQQELPQDAPLAKVGAQTITHKEFLSRYELTPGLQRQNVNKTDEKKAEVLFTLIAEKLLAQQSREEGFDRDTVLVNAVHGVERLFVRDELYRREVSAKVSITPKEIEQAKRRAQDDRKVYFLYAKTQQTADSLYALIQAGTPLESFRFSPQQQETMSLDSAVTRWGDADERMEAAVYALKTNETAKPVKLDDGYYIPKLMGRSLSIAVGEREQQALQERVTQILRKRKEQKRMFDFMASALKDKKTEVKAKLSKDVIMDLWAAYEALTPADMKRNDTAKFFLTDDIVEWVLHHVGADSLAPFVEFGHTTWTLATTLNKMRVAGLAIEHPSLAAIRYGYEERLRDLIDQENLTQIGYEHGLQHTDAVQKELGPWRDWYLAQMYKNAIEDTITVSKKELENEKWRLMRDTLNLRDTSQARANVVTMKAQYFTDKNLASLADKFGITVYEKNFSAVKVTNIPAMVYRYLGFGGRMFAVPLTQPDIRWIDFWDRKNIQLP